MIRSKIAMGFFWAILALVFHVLPGAVGPAHAQGSRKDDIVFNSRGVPLAGATVRVCAMPASGQPCTPLALIYSDPALTQALANPTTSDGLGNYFFYAAPGKYEIEISGPGITTKQIPNVILPSDPTSPNFSSLSSSGAINAFTLNLTGNLSVNGNTTVLGNLASGTLNLTNQVTPPGAAGSGTVNLYTKTADKRLYYKDETGAEIGPIANTTGAQTNVTNTFTAPQNIDADFHTKGPNPGVDITRFGARQTTYNQTPSQPGITSSITIATPTATLSAASTFQNGDGVVIFGAGAPQAMATPAAPTVTPSVAAAGTGTGIVVNGPSGGATTYNYQVIWRDKAGGMTASSSVGTTATGAAALGAQNVAISTLSRSGLVVTVATSAAHGLSVGSMVYVTGTSDATNFGGWYVVDTVADNTHFTFSSGLDTASGASASATGGTANWFNCNHIVVGSIPAGGYQFFIYGRTGGSLTLLGVSKPNGGVVTDLTWDDFGSPMMDNFIAPYYVPTTPPGAATSDHLVTTIVSGAGTTTLTLANNAGTTVAGATILYDSAPTILAAANAARFVGALYIPAGGSFVVNSYLTLPTGVGISQAGGLVLNDTVEIGTSTRWYGNRVPVGANVPAFSFEGQNAIQITRASPGLYANLNSSGTSLHGLQFTSTQTNNANLVILDGSQFYIDWVNFLSGTNNSNYMSMGLILRGTPTNSAFFNTLRNVTFTDGPAQTNGVSATPLFYCNQCGDTTIDDISLSRRGLFFKVVDAGMGLRLNSARFQGGIVPFISIWHTGGNIGGWFLIDQAELDTGAHAWFANFTSSFSGMVIFKGVNSPSFETNGTIGYMTGRPVGNVTLLNASSGPAQAVIMGQNTSLSIPSAGYFSNNSAQVNGTLGSFGYQMATPAAPQSAVVSAGGSVPVATWTYKVSAVDFDGKETILGPGTNATTSGGNQTVTVTGPASLPLGAANFSLCRTNGGGCAITNGGTGLGAAFVYVDTFGFTQGGGNPNGAASATALSINGMAATKVRVAGEAFTASPRGEQNIFLPGALTSAWTGSTWTLDKGVTVTRVQVQAKTAPAGCTTNAIVRLTDGTTPVNVTITAAANDSGAIAQNYAASAALTISVQTAAAGCTTSPADGNVTIQYRMQ